MPNLPVAANRRVPAEVCAKVQRAFLALGKTDEGRALLAKVPMTEIVATTLPVIFRNRDGSSGPCAGGGLVTRGSPWQDEASLRHGTRAQQDQHRHVGNSLT